jgi:hypothetical protein
MTYPAAMIRLLILDPSGVRQLSVNHLPWICMFHVSVLGLIYGGTAAWLTREMLSGQGLLKLTLAGIPVAFLMHAGAALFIWVFLKALGGKAAFLTAYFFIGVAAISLWPLAPFLAMLQTYADPIAFAGAFVTAPHALAVHTRTLQIAIGISLPKMILAMTAAIVYIGCFLYLWI